MTKFGEKSWVTVATNHETAQGALNRIIKKRKDDVKAQKKRDSYVLKEFLKDRCPEGRRLENQKIQFLPETVDSLIRGLDKGNKTPFENICKKIKHRLGIPYIVMPQMPPVERRRIRSPEEISARLDKMEKRNRRELRELQEICPDIKENTNVATVASLKILKWVYNKSSVRNYDSVVGKLYNAKVKMERDRLFHLRRHKGKKNMNICFQKDINAEISELEWLLLDNPFKFYVSPGFFETHQYKSRYQ